MKKLGQQISRAWSALCQADFTETADFAQRMRRLGITEEEIARQLSAASPHPRKLIVLVIQVQATKAALDYVCEAVARLQVDVAVLSAAGAKPLAPSFAHACAAQGAGRVEQLVVPQLECGLRSFLQQHAQTMFLVCGDAGVPGRWLSALAVPLVQVTELPTRPAMTLTARSL